MRIRKAILTSLPAAIIVEAVAKVAEHGMSTIAESVETR